MAKPLYFFDLDNTVLNGDSSSMWCHYMVEHGLVKDPQSFLKRERELVASYDAGTMILQDYLNFLTSPIVSHPADEVDRLIAAYIERDVAPRIFPQARKLFSELKAQGAGVVLISASADLIVNAVGKVLGLEPENIIAVHLERKDGFYTSHILGTPSFREGKITNVELWLAAHPEYDPHFSFYTDSINDLPLCLEAAHTFVVNPSPLLLQEAQAHNWPILDWKGEVAQQRSQAQ